MITDSAMSPEDSRIASLSIRSVGFISLLWTVCLIELARTASAIYVMTVTSTSVDVTIKEPLYSLVLLATGYYFGQKKDKP